MMARQRLRFRLRLSRVIPSSFSFNCRSKRSTSTSTSTHHPLQPPIINSYSSSSGAEADAEPDHLNPDLACCPSSYNDDSTDYSPSPSSPPRTKIDSRLFPPRFCTRRRLTDCSSSGDDSGWFSTDDDDFSAARSESDTRDATTASNCFAVSKVSADPRGDFRQSMAEMVAERGIHDVEGLRWLLHCFLSLNHGRHQHAILAAFADVWYAVFPSVALATSFPNMFYK